MTQEFTYLGFLTDEAVNFFEGKMIREERDGCAVVGAFIKLENGGTSVWVELSVKSSLKTIEEADDCQKYYLDNRIGSTTKGELYDKYPSEKGALVLDKNNFNFIKTEL